MTASSIAAQPLESAAAQPDQPSIRLAMPPPALAAVDAAACRAPAGTELQLRPGQALWLPAHAIAAITCLQGGLTVERLAGAVPHAPPLRLAAGEPPWELAAQPSAWLRLQPWPRTGCTLRLQARPSRSMLARMASAVAQWTGWSAPG